MAGQSPATERTHYRTFLKRTKPGDNARGAHALPERPRSDGRVRTAPGHAYHSKMIDAERIREFRDVSRPIVQRATAQKIGQSYSRSIDGKDSPAAHSRVFAQQIRLKP